MKRQGRSSTMQAFRFWAINDDQHEELAGTRPVGVRSDPREFLAAV